MNTPDIQMVVEQLRAAYLRSLSQKLPLLRDAATARDFKVIQMHAHRMKGSGRSYGFPEISDIAARIEEAGQGGQGHVIESLLVELERTAQQLSVSAPSAQ